jgi:sugar phosphate isomerase/epimerase
MRERLKWVNGDASSEHDLTRRRLLGSAAAAAVGLGAVGESSASLAVGGGKVPRSRRALMQETVRDLVVNSPATYPSLPAGYRQVFEAGARIGFTGFEFLSYSGAPTFPQHPSAEGGASVSPTQIRAWLDESGLEAVGHYNASTTPTGFVGLTPATIDAALATAQTLGQPQTGSLDATLSYRQKDQIDPIVETWNQMAVKASKAGIPIYTHAHSAPWNFLLDTGPRDAAGNYTRSSGVRVMEYFLQHTDPRWVKLEMDVFWAYVGRFRFTTYTAGDGTTVTRVFDPAATAGRFAARSPIFHAKDGISVPSNPDGWVIVPFGFGDIDFDRFFRLARAGKHRPYWSSEQDNAPGAAADPQKSLRDAASGYRGLATLGTRGGVGAPFAGHNVG